MCIPRTKIQGLKKKVQGVINKTILVDIKLIKFIIESQTLPDYICVYR